MKSFDTLSEREMLALAISLELAILQRDRRVGTTEFNRSGPLSAIYFRVSVLSCLIGIESRARRCSFRV